MNLRLLVSEQKLWKIKFLTLIAASRQATEFFGSKDAKQRQARAKIGFYENKCGFLFYYA